MLKPNETVLIGGSEPVDGRFVADETSQRIAALVENVLTKIADLEDRWSTLHKDPSDGRLWQLAYENSGQHGGGMPTLKVSIQAKLKYSSTCQQFSEIKIARF